MFCVMTMVLNEEKFLPFALKGYLSSPLVEKIVIVEGCVELNKAAAGPDGLSGDGTARVISRVSEGDKSKRVVFEQVGWAKNKEELQNRCLELAEKHAPKAEYYILAGGDEVYDPADLERLKKEIERLGHPDIPLYEFVHLWKRPDWRARGSTWDWWMHRCYKNYGPGMRFGFHAGPPFKPDGSKLKSGVKTKGVKVFHYAAMKDRKDILDRIDFYKKRDKKGRDTWTDWEPGKPTQWTHGGGTAEPYDGPHPPAIADAVWGLVPDLPRPKVVVYLTPDERDHAGIEPFIARLAGLVPLTVVGLTNPRWKGVKFRKIDDLEKQLKGAEWLIVASRSVVPKPVASKRNAVFAYAPPSRHLRLSGYRVFCLDKKTGATWSGKSRIVDDPAKLLLDIDRLPVVFGGGPAPASLLPPTRASAGQTGRASTPGKVGKMGKIEVIGTRPFTVAWHFTNPLSGGVEPKHGYLGYGLRTANGRKVRSLRHIVGVPKLPSGGAFLAEFTVPVNSVRSGEYVLNFDFRYKGHWSGKPLKLMLHLDKNGGIWVR